MIRSRFLLEVLVTPKTRTRAVQSGKKIYPVTDIVQTPGSPSTNLRFDITYEADGGAKTETFIINEPLDQSRYGLIGDSDPDDPSVPVKWRMRPLTAPIDGHKHLVTVHRISDDGEPPKFELER